MTVHVLHQPTWLDRRLELERAREVAGDAIAGKEPGAPVTLETWVVEALLRKIRAEEQFADLCATPPQ